jgi:long-chain fatty acid transport protein
MKKQLLLTSLLLSSVMAFGAGYQLNLQGLRQLAMGGSGTAIAWDASSIFYNPGAMAQLENIQVSASALAIIPSTQYVQSPGNYSATTQQQVFTPFNVYIAGPVAYKSRVNIGLGIYTPFGSGTKWDEDWMGRYITTNIKLQSIFLQPTASVYVNEWLSVGAGFIYAFGNVQINKNIPLQNMNSLDSKADLKGDAQGVGFNVGVQLTPGDKWEFGITYRSRVNMKVRNGDALFTAPASLQSSFPVNSFKSTLPLPEVISVGAGYHVNDRLTLQADLQLVGWKAYDSLVIDFAENTNTVRDSRDERNYKNTLAVRIGGHYKLGDRVSVMLGGAYDPTPVRNGIVTPDLPDANRWVGSGGVTFKATKKFTVLGAIEYVSSQKRTASYDAAGFSGIYQTKAITPGVGITYDF